MYVPVPITHAAGPVPLEEVHVGSPGVLRTWAWHAKQVQEVLRDSRGAWPRQRRTEEGCVAGRRNYQQRVRHARRRLTPSCDIGSGKHRGLPPPGRAAARMAAGMAGARRACRAGMGCRVPLGRFPARSLPRALLLLYLSGSIWAGAW